MHAVLRFRDEHGQTMAEYAVVLALITLVTVGVFTALGNSVENGINAVRSIVFP